MKSQFAKMIQRRDPAPSIFDDMARDAFGDTELAREAAHRLEQRAMCECAGCAGDGCEYCEWTGRVLVRHQNPPA